MLELDLDLEADLGVDTVKQAETFAAIRKEFNIPLRDDLNLRAYNTIEKVIGFVEEMRPDLVESKDQRVKIEDASSSQPPIANLQSSHRRWHHRQNYRPHRRANGLSRRHVGTRPGFGSGFGCGHRQTSRNVRRHSQRVQYSLAG